MGSSVYSPSYVEHAVVPDIYASGMAMAEEIGEGNYRFTFYVNHRSVHDGSAEREIVCRIILPTASVHAAIQMALEGVGSITPQCNGCQRFVRN